MDNKELVEDFSRNIDREIAKLNFKDANIFNILKTERTEIRHSNFLAWLFDAKESHNLGDRVLKSFIERLENKNKDKFKDLVIENIDYTSFKVGREIDYIDLLLTSEKEKFIICIENKIDSIEHNEGQTEIDQTYGYKDKVLKWYPKGEYRHLFIYLSAQNEKPADGEWISTDYQDIYDILTQVLKEDEISNDVRYLLECYVEILKRNYVQDESFKKVCKEIYYKYKDSWKIIESKATDTKEIYQMLKQRLEENKYCIVSYNSIIHLSFNTEYMKEIFKYNNNIFYNIEIGKDIIKFTLQMKYEKLSLDEISYLKSQWIKYINKDINLKARYPYIDKGQYTINIEDDIENIINDVLQQIEKFVVEDEEKWRKISIM